MQSYGRQKQKLLSVFSNGDIRKSVAPLKQDSALALRPATKRKHNPVQQEELDRNLAGNKRLRRTLRAEEDSQGEDEEDGPVPETLLTVESLPEDMHKYWEQRYRLFSLFDSGIRMDKDGWFSVTPENVAAQIAERCRCNVILDAFTGVGGNAIQFAFTCERVIAIDNDPVRLACAAHNAKVYGVADRIHFILADYVTWAKEYAEQPFGENHPKIDVVFLSPPWGGVAYQTFADASDSPSKGKSRTGEYSLQHLQPLPGQQLFELSRALTANVALFLPRNTSVDQIANLTTETVEIEEAWMGNKLKALTVYSGEIADAP